MNLPYQEIVNCFADAAIKAGEYIYKSLGSGFDVNRKAELNTEASSVVTVVDLKAQTIILDVLKPLMRQYDFGLLTEELEDDGSRFKKDFFVCVDPLDGTLAFIENRLGFSVSIALVSQSGHSVVGVVYEPINKTIYTAHLNGGAYKNKTVLNAASSYDDIFTLFADKSLTKQPEFDTICKECAQHAEANNYKFVIRQEAGAVINALWTLENGPALYLKPPKANKGGGGVWDFAATACILKEAGLLMRNYDNNKLNLNPTGTVYMNQSGIRVENF